jgi:hypothetical protein
MGNACNAQGTGRGELGDRVGQLIGIKDRKLKARPAYLRLVRTREMGKDSNYRVGRNSGELEAGEQSTIICS